MASVRLWLITWCIVSSEFMANAVAHHSNYREEWVVRIEGGDHVAYLLALQTGYKHVGQVRGFKDTYVWLKDNSHGQEKRDGLRLTKALNSSSKIIWADHQKVIQRFKRDYVPLFDYDSDKPLIREKRLEVDQYRLNSVEDNDRNLYGYESDISKLVFNDELWDQEWYLQDTRSNKALPKLDLNVLPLYRLGITGRGVRIAVVDDGLEHTHQDLRNNYDPTISYDLVDGDDDPTPQYKSVETNNHGTRCAGEIAMEANNRKCGVGIAYEASIGGIKFLNHKVTDRLEGEALGYKPEMVDIYTASWGPSDKGTSLEAPGRLTTEALERGTTMGRNGRGSIYVWASGNGGLHWDDCSCDGYVGSIYTIAIASATQSGRIPWYGESCPATVATTYSSGAYHDQQIATTDLGNNCTTQHTGTSASAPLAAGIVALALQVNKNLTWRDVQHLIVWTSEYSPLRDNAGWFKNSAGFWFNSRFGFGLMNAYALVMASYDWTTVPEKSVCKVDVFNMFDKRLTYGERRSLLFETDECQLAGNEIMFLEHVEIEVSLEYSLRGALQMNLIAPSGTRVQILNPRKLDTSDEGFQKWRFMSVATWGEDPRGSWTLNILDEIGPKENNGTIEALTLILHGTREPPEYRKNGPRIYNQDYNRIRKTSQFLGANRPPISVFETKYNNLNGGNEETNDMYEKSWLNEYS